MAGQPKKYETKEELQAAIDKYFYNSTHDKDGNERDKEKPISITGLALALGFASRQSIADYNGKDEYSYTIKQAKLRIENFLEERLLSNNVAGVIFNLKNNYGWKDKLDIGGDLDLNVNNLSDAELDEQIAEKERILKEEENKSKNK